MPLQKCTAIFSYSSNKSGAASNTRQGGWSESLYAAYDDFSVLKNRFETWCYWRAALLSNAAAIVGQRYQSLDPLGKSVKFGTRVPGNTAAGDVPQMALQIVIPAQASPNSRRFELRGINDSAIQEGEYVPTVNFTFNLGKFVEQCGYFRMQGKNLTAPEVTILSIDNTGVFQLAQPLTYAARQYLQLSRVKLVTNQDFNGVVFVETHTSDTAGKFGNWTFGPGSGGTARLYELTYPQLDGTATVYPVAMVKKVGRPSSGYRGRRSARKSL